MSRVLHRWTLPIRRLTLALLALALASTLLWIGDGGVGGGLTVRAQDQDLPEATPGSPWIYTYKIVYSVANADDEEYEGLIVLPITQYQLRQLRTDAEKECLPEGTSVFGGGRMDRPTTCPDPLPPVYVAPFDGNFTNVVELTNGRFDLLQDYEAITYDQSSDTALLTFQTTVPAETTRVYTLWGGKSRRSIAGRVNHSPTLQAQLANMPAGSLIRFSYGFSTGTPLETRITSVPWNNRQGFIPTFQARYAPVNSGPREGRISALNLIAPFPFKFNYSQSSESSLSVSLTREYYRINQRASGGGAVRPFVSSEFFSAQSGTDFPAEFNPAVPRTDISTYQFSRDSGEVGVGPTYQLFIGQFRTSPAISALSFLGTSLAVRDLANIETIGDWGHSRNGDGVTPDILPNLDGNGGSFLNAALESPFVPFRQDAYSGDLREALISTHTITIRAGNSPLAINDFRSGPRELDNYYPPSNAGLNAIDNYLTDYRIPYTNIANYATMRATALGREMVDGVEYIRASYPVAEFSSFDVLLPIVQRSLPGGEALQHLNVRTLFAGAADSPHPITPAVDQRLGLLAPLFAPLFTERNVALFPIATFHNYFANTLEGPAWFWWLIVQTILGTILIVAMHKYGLGLFGNVAYAALAILLYAVGAVPLWVMLIFGVLPPIALSGIKRLVSNGPGAQA